MRVLAALIERESGQSARRTSSTARSPSSGHVEPINAVAGESHRYTTRNWALVLYNGMFNWDTFRGNKVFIGTSSSCNQCRGRLLFLADLIFPCRRQLLAVRLRQDDAHSTWEWSRSLACIVNTVARKRLSSSPSSRMATQTVLSPCPVTQAPSSLLETSVSLGCSRVVLAPRQKRCGERTLSSILT